jgi:protein-tyrosine phosphatase
MSQRLLPLEGGRNFRDMGGYRTDDGAVVRWGRLYRSGALSGLTQADHRHLSTLGIAVICDFRTTGERVDEPTLWPGERAPVIRSRDYDHANSLRMSRIAEAGASAGEAIKAAMASLYAEMPYRHLESYQVMFGELLAGNLPMVINCSAGKDRTGVGAALVLSALGVRWDEIVHDYSLSEQVVDFEAVATAAGASDMTTGFASLAKLPKDVRMAILRSDPAYLLAMREGVERRDGSITDYLRVHLGVGAPETAALRSQLLQPG